MVWVYFCKKTVFVIKMFLFKRGNRSLALLMNESNTEVEQKEQGQEGEVQDAEEGYEVPDAIEEVIDELLTGLRSQETIVRWSAAKGQFNRFVK